MQSAVSIYRMRSNYSRTKLSRMEDCQNVRADVGSQVLGRYSQHCGVSLSNLKLKVLMACSYV